MIKVFHILGWKYAGPNFFFLVYAHTMYSQPPSGETLLGAQKKNK